MRRTRVFDPATEAWRPVNSSLFLPAAGSASFLNVGGELYLLPKNNLVYRLNQLGDPAWEPQGGAQVNLGRYGTENFAYAMPYHRLLN